MANPAHLEILKQGVKVWNKWREESPDVRPDLIEADLSLSHLSEVNFHRTKLLGTILSYSHMSGANLLEADLRGANLSDANLSGAYLNRANLRGAHVKRAVLAEASLIETNLIGSRLEGVNLSKANLSHADLRLASLSFADLMGADLTQTKMAGAYLHKTNLNEANLSRAIFLGTHLNDTQLTKADLRSVKLGETVFANCNLSEIIGLTDCMHSGPSIIDQRTLVRSRELPLEFLRGIGLPDNYIEYIPSLFHGDAIQYYSCFISYSSHNQDFAERLYADLQNKGVRCWFAPEDMKIGDKIRHAIDSAIRLKDKLLVILSETSVSSQWVETEVETAMEEERERGEPVLFPLRIDEAVMETNETWARMLRRERNIGDFTGWKNHDSYQKAFERLLRDLKA